MTHLLHVFPLISLHELTQITDAYQWNAHDHFEQTILSCGTIGFCYRDINRSLYLLSVNILPMVETVLQKP